MAMRRIGASLISLPRAKRFCRKFRAEDGLV
jgi:hypothetical protein